MAADKRILLCAAFAATAVANAQVDLPARDAAMTRGSITYHKVQGPVNREVALVYSKDGRRSERFDNLGKSGLMTSSDTFVQGKNWNLDETVSPANPPFGSQDTVLLGRMDSAYGSFYHESDKPTEGISWTPSIALGGGLSTLRARSMSKSPLTIEGNLVDGDRVRAVYGALQSKGIPDRIERSRDGKLFQVWVFKGAIAAGGGIYVPKHVERQTKGGMVIATFDIEKADFSKQPTDAALTTNWFHPGANYDAGYAGVYYSYDKVLADNHGNKALTPEEFQAYAKADYDRNPQVTFIGIGPPPDTNRILGMPWQLFKYEVSVFVLTCAAIALAVLLKRRFAR